MDPHARNIAIFMYLKTKTIPEFFELQYIHTKKHIKRILSVQSDQNVWIVNFFQNNIDQRQICFKITIASADVTKT